ncbi:MAG: TetR/AcrR family transcriptional regulator [Parvibaculum sp.]|nr:TetR/AcrR family transcriptional regulator [Parvibaculum sp.]
MDRAAHVIAEQGIESLSLRALARDLGVSHAAPARHFADKAELLRALATEGNDRFIAYILEAADATGSDPLVRYAAMGKAFIRFSLLYPAYYRTITHPDVATHADADLKASAERRNLVVLDAARAAQAAGWLTNEKTEDVVLFSIATVRGVSAILSDPLTPYRDEDADALIERMVDLIIDPKNPQRNSLSKRKGAAQ